MLYGLRYINEVGDEIVFGSDQYKVIAYDGFGEVNADVQTQKAPYQDGSTWIDSVLNERYLYINFVIRGESYKELAAIRQFVGRVFSPKLRGTLYLKNGEEEYEINCYPEHVPNFPDGGTDAVGRMQTANINLVAPNPYWMSTDETAEQLVAFGGGLTFPLNLPTIFGNRESDSKSRIIVNNSDATAPIEVTFDGPAESPIRIENETTGEFIEVAQSLDEGEKLVINTAFGQKKVEKVMADGTRENAFHYIYIDPTGQTPSSAFFELLPGNNLITYDTGGDYDTGAVTVRFKERYLTV